MRGEDGLDDTGDIGGRGSDCVVRSDDGEPRSSVVYTGLGGLLDEIDDPDVIGDPIGRELGTCRDPGEYLAYSFCVHCGGKCPELLDDVGES